MLGSIYEIIPFCTAGVDEINQTILFVGREMAGHGARRS